MLNIFPVIKQPFYSQVPVKNNADNPSTPAFLKKYIHLEHTYNFISLLR